MRQRCFHVPKQPQKTASRTLVLSSFGELLYRAPFGEAAKLIKRGVAVDLPGSNCIRLIANRGEPHPCRTRTARAGILAAIGRGQDYTIRNERGIVNGFK